MSQVSLPPFNIQKFIADTLSDQSFAERKVFLVRGAKHARRVASTTVEWYQSLEPGRFVLWYQALESWGLHRFHELANWLTSPQAIKLGMGWLIVFFIVYMLVAYMLGFGIRGVVTGSIAAAWQSYAYGAFTPLGSIFAFLTSMAMMGKMQSIAAIAGAIVATIFTAGMCIFGGS